MNQSEEKFFELMQQGVFEIDDKGRIWRKAELKTGRRFKDGRDTQPRPINSRQIGHIAKNGYVITSFHYQGKTHTVSVHRLVWIYFFGDIPEGKEVNHKHGNKADNRPSELELVTEAGNIQHAYDTGLITTHGERHPCAKLTLSQVEEIRQRYALGNATQKALAQEFGVGKSSIWDIVNNQTWTREPNSVRFQINAIQSEEIQ